jgi:SAM-dependent methyltransferase
VSTPSTWGWRRRAANALDQAHLLGPAISVYEALLGVRGALRTATRAEAGGPPVPPAHLRVKVGPAHADLDVFLRSGAQHADLVRSVLEESGSDPVAAAPILDFGCGCGRVARHWYGLDVELHGCDVNRRMIEWCRQNLPFGRFDVNRLEPPLPYDDGSFGLAYAFSVFTHLPEGLQRDWLREFERVLRPGGYFFFSTLGEYYVGLDRLTEHERRRFDSGNLVVLFDDHAGENVCSAYHPQTYVEGRMAEEFDYVVYRKGNEHEHHDMHLLRKRPRKSRSAVRAAETVSGSLGSR